MSYTQTFTNGQVLTSSALSDEDMTDLMQKAICYCLGIYNSNSFQVNLQINNPIVSLFSVNGLQIGFVVSGNNIVNGTTILSINALNNTITLSNAPTATANESILIANNNAGNIVRKSWQTSGAPAYNINDQITFVRCTEVNNSYNKVMDQNISYNDSLTANLESEYTRVWETFLELRGPDAHLRASQIRSCFLQGIVHDMLAASNVYLVTNVDNPTRAPELFEGKWWERTDLRMYFNEQVNESIATPTVISTEVLVYDANGLQRDITVQE